MRVKDTEGLTLVELLVTISILGIISIAAAALLSTALQAHETGTDRSDLYRQGLFAMDRMTRGVRITTIVMIPNAHSPNRTLLAISDMVNDDNDFYFGDPLFPRIDEDLGSAYNSAGFGVGGYDDDDDGMTDEGVFKDDDEDGISDEDPWNGIDDDGDGRIDEDTGSDMSDDFAPGIAGMDDDGDGEIDEGTAAFNKDDDEDGLIDESIIAPIVYDFRLGRGELWEVAVDPSNIFQPLRETLLVSQVTSFTTTYETPERILIQLTLTGEKGESVAFSEYAYPRNVLQRNGKRVR